jgi:uncharacterized protein
MKSTKAKKNALIQKVLELGNSAVAYSGGTDSTLLLKICSDILDKRDLTAFIVKTEFISKYDLQQAVSTLKKLKCRFNILEKNLLDYPGIAENSKKRCYLCKKEIFLIIKKEAKRAGLSHVLDGTNYDDLSGVHRPGIKALNELGIISPFAELGITKSEIRDWAKELNLPVWDKPPNSCLATRVPFNRKLDTSILKLVENAEDIIRGLSIRLCRVRIHDGMARIEVAHSDFRKILTDKNHSFIIKEFKKLGFKHIVLDIEGFKSGSMDN